MNRYILYDYLQVAGGAERLTLDLASGLPEYQVVVSRIYPEAELLSLPESMGRMKIRALGTPISKLLRRVPEAITSFKYRTRFLRDAEVVLYSGLYAPFAIANQQRGRSVYYCHTPPRYAYDWKDLYLSRIPGIIRPIAEMTIRALAREYEASLMRMDRVIANSENVRSRLQHYLGVQADVVYPPIDTEGFRWEGQDEYFVSLARLEPQKRVDMIIRAFLAMPDQKLVVVSGGSDEVKLKVLAAGATNIFFVGWQNEARLRELLGRARAAIYIPVDEDFGMSPVEAMAAGKPVIGVAEGGLTETLIDGVTGVLIHKNISVEAIIDAVYWLTAKRSIDMRESCEARAKLFSKSVFLDRMKSVLEAV